jgi:transposase
MMGQHDRSEALFYYFRLEDQVPENHLLRLIEKHITSHLINSKRSSSRSGVSVGPVPPPRFLRVQQHC